MSKIKHPDVPLYISKKQAYILPENLRKRGIASKRELIFFVSPYMEWVSTDFIKDRFYAALKQPALGKEVLRYLKFLLNEGHFERRDGPKKGWRKTVEWRRVSREIGVYAQRQARIEGRIFGGMRKKSTKPKPVKNLTMDDIRFIQQYHDSISIKEMQKMFKTSYGTIKNIQNGKLPVHLRKKRSVSRFLNNPG